MEISKWGKRVEEVMAQASPELTFQEQISAKALKTELEEHCVLLGHWFVRKSRTFQDCTIEVLYDFPMDWYEVTISYSARTPSDPKMRDYWATMQIRAEDLEDNTKTTTRWVAYLEERWRGLRGDLSKKLLDAGVSLDDASPLNSMVNGGWYEATGRTRRFTTEDREIVTLPWRKRVPGVLMTWAVPRPPTAREEQEAIESIKEAMGNADH